MFYAPSALLAEQNLTSTRHSGIHALFGEHFAKPGRIEPKFHRFLLDAFDRRLQADYGLEIVITREEVATTLDQAREFLSTVESLLAGKKLEFGVGFDLDEHVGVDERANLDHGGARADGVEEFTVSAAVFLPATDVGDKHARAHHVG